jgi:hypothetical protein
VRPIDTLELLNRQYVADATSTNRLNMSRWIHRTRRKSVVIAGLTTLMILGYVGRRPIRLAIAYLRSTTHFVSLPDDPRILFEPGAEDLAQKIADALPTSIEMVEKAQYRDFPHPVCVYVCASVDSFTRFTANRRAGGMVIGTRLFISPKPENTTERVPGLLTHELSHLHLAQFSEGWSAPPSWFLEGLAVYVSNGGGAETVSDSEAIRAIVEGRHFRPVASESAFFPSVASDFDLSHHMYYRQASVFVRFLHDSDAQSFKNLMVRILDGASFPEAFIECYGHDPIDEWEQFVRSLLASQSSREAASPALDSSGAAA